MSTSVSKCPFHNTEHINEFDALSEEVRANPWLFNDWLRDDEGRNVYKLPHEKSFYVVHRYEDVKNILADAENFSSKIIPSFKSPFFVLMDGADHKRIRTIVGNMLSQKNILQWENYIRKIIQHTTSQLGTTGKAELFKAWADKIPLQILSFLFGMKEDDQSIEKLHNYAIAINRALFVTGGTGPRRSNNPNASEKFFISISLLRNSAKLFRLWRLIGNTGFKEMRLMLLIEKNNMDTPRPDFKAIPGAITPLLDLMIYFATWLKAPQGKNVPAQEFRNAVANGEATLTEMLMAGAFILFAGYETTASLLSNCFTHLAKHPSLFKHLKDQPDKIDDFIEESLRYYTPVGRFLRRTTKDVNLNGKIIPADSVVLLMTGAANTDPEKFENGCIFDPERNNAKQNLSFGKGAHYCIGAPLARLQISIALKELISKFSSIEVDESKPLKMVTDRDNGILRYEEVWVKVKL